MGIDLLFNNLQVLTDKGDYLIMGIDFNQDAKSLDAAYNNYWLEQLALNIMRRLKELVAADNFNPEAFDFVYNWNTGKRTVEISLKAQIDQEIIIEEEHFLIRTGDSFHLINSKKFVTEEVEELMRVNNFKIAEVLEEGDSPNSKAKLIVAKKI